MRKFKSPSKPKQAATYHDRLVATCRAFDLPEQETAAIAKRVDLACEKLANSRNASHQDLLTVTERELRKVAPKLADFYHNYDRII